MGRPLGDIHMEQASLLARRVKAECLIVTVDLAIHSLISPRIIVIEKWLLVHRSNHGFLPLFQARLNTILSRLQESVKFERTMIDFANRNNTDKEAEEWKVYLQYCSRTSVETLVVQFLASKRSLVTPSTAHTIIFAHRRYISWSNT